MKKVTKNNLLKLIEMKKTYNEQEEKDKKILFEINDYIENVINKDKKYFIKLKSYNFTEDQLKYLL